MGSGKTTVLGEASDVLASRGVVHSAIDVDGLSVGHVPAAASDDLMIRNLAAVWNSYAAAGVTKLLLSEALDTSAKRERLHEALPGAAIVVRQQAR